MMNAGNGIPDANHGLWLEDWDDCALIPLDEDSECLGDGGTERFAGALLDELAGASGVRRGAFLGLEGNAVIIPEGALEDACSGAPFEVRPTLVFDAGLDGGAYVAMALQVLTIPSGIGRPSLDAACKNSAVPASAVRLPNGRLAVQAWMLVDGGHAPSAAGDAMDACLALDEIVAEALVFERLSELNVIVEPWDPAGVLESFGFGGEFARRQADGFRQEYPDPEWQLFAPFALPYNLEVVREAGILDAVAREAGSMPFGFDRFMGRRWFFGGRIIRALLRLGFSPEQVAYVVCNDDDLMTHPADRVEAVELCEQIEHSAFDPASVDDWNAYVATEDGPLLGFL